MTDEVYERVQWIFKRLLEIVEDSKKAGRGNDLIGGTPDAEEILVLMQELVHLLRDNPDYGMRIWQRRR